MFPCAGAQEDSSSSASGAVREAGARAAHYPSTWRYIRECGALSEHVVLVAAWGLSHPLFRVQPPSFKLKRLGSAVESHSESVSLRVIPSHSESWFRQQSPTPATPPKRPAGGRPPGRPVCLDSD